MVTLFTICFSKRLKVKFVFPCLLCCM